MTKAFLHDRTEAIWTSQSQSVSFTGLSSVSFMISVINGHAVDEPAHESDSFFMREYLLHTKFVGRTDDFTRLLVACYSFNDNGDIELLGQRRKSRYAHIIFE